MRCERGERLASALLVALFVIAAGVLLYLNRGTTFWNDQLTWLGNLSLPHDLEYFLLPHNSHLIATTRAAYLWIAELGGTDFVALRILGVGGVLATAALFYVWAKPRIGAGWALLPAALLLFYGSAWQHVVGSIGFTVTSSIALGLGALIALERPGRGRDLLACGLLVLSVLSYTVGLAYLVGAAVSVLLRGDRLRRIWILLIPLALYVAWWIWARQFDQNRTEIDNLVHVFEFFARSMAVNAGGITGVNIPWLRLFDPGPVTDARASLLGWLVGAAITAALVWRVRRGGLPRSFWASLGVLVTFWLAAAIADVRAGGTDAAAIRYLFPGSTALLLVLVDAVSGVRIRASWAYAVLAVFAFSLAMNLIFLRDGAEYLRDQGRAARIELAMLELRAGLDPGAPGGTTPPDAAAIAAGAAVPDGTFPEQYLQAVARYGSPAMTLAEVTALPEPLRRVADSALAADGGIAVLPLADADQPRHLRHCRVLVGGEPNALASGLVYVRALGGTPVELTANRFAEPPGLPIGTVAPERWSVLAVAADRSPQQWSTVVPETGRMRACRIAPSG
jgi:hypothetical protein